jgi:hypothetical protein
MSAKHTSTAPRPPAGPIFIVGYMHSGTTLLRKIIGRNSQVYSIRAETMFFDQLDHQLPERFPNLSDDSVFEAYVRYLIHKTRFDWPPVTAAEAELEAAQFQVDEALERRIIAGAKTRRDYAAVFNYVYKTVSAVAGKPYWLEKTPSHIFHVECIIEKVPGVRFIELTRDPRDVLASKKVRKTTNWADRYGDKTAERMQIRKGYDPLRDSLGWRAAVRAGAEAQTLHPGCFYRLRYEDLVSAPEREIDQLCRWLGLSYEPAMLAVGWSNTTAHSGVGKAPGIDRSAIGKWRAKLSDDVVGLCQMINREEMIALGYALHDVPIGSRVKAPFWVARSGVDLAARTYALWRGGGATHVESMARNSWRRVGHLSKK